MRILIEAANTTVAVEDDRIVEPSGSFDHVVCAPKGEVRPGLINAHEHLHRNHYGRLGAPPYANAYEWARDIQSRNRIEIARGREMRRREALLIGAWKNLISGATHVCHHDVWEPDFDTGFPLDVIRLPTADSLGMTQVLPPPEGPFAMHVAEGIDAAAAEEIRELGRRGFLTPDFLAVHAVGADEGGVTLLRRSGCAVIWCPSSNRFLFGRTAPAALLAEGADILLGTDSLLTGGGTILDEMRMARRDMSDARILDAVGPVAARRLGVAQTSLATGAHADIVVSRAPILESRSEDIVLVIADGVLRILEPDLAAAFRPSGGHAFEAFGVRRWIDNSPG